jgi:tryptophan-rich sensory protein
VRGSAPYGEAGRGWSGLVVFLALSAIVSGLGGLATSTSVGDWYQTLHKPAFTPPDRAFAPVWTVLYILMALAAWRVWRKVGWRHKAIRLYLAQLALNFAWSLLFFGGQTVGIALLDILLLTGAIVATTLAFWRIDHWAAALMIPYLLWVAYAVLLNAAIWWMN